MTSKTTITEVATTEEEAVIYRRQPIGTIQYGGEDHPMVVLLDNVRYWLRDNMHTARTVEEFTVEFDGRPLTVSLYNGDHHATGGMA